ncbi:hypothetical protein JCM10450v2_004617 [Rhodotorula kratochvilovae]
MATVRTAFHRDEEVRRRSQVDSLLASTQPGATIKGFLSISPESNSLAALRSSAARTHRRARLREFIDMNCTAAMPGTHPFFTALFAALWVQAMDSRRGGAGERIVEWEVDVAVFTEAGGNEAWAGEAIEALKGVLGMTERIKEPSHTDSLRTSYLGSSAASETSSVAGGEPVIAPVIFEHPAPVPPGAQGGHRKEPPPVPPHRGSGSLRNRSGSDPFLHPAEKAARQQKQTQVVSPLSPSSSLPPSPDPSTSSPSASVPLLASTSPLTPTAPPLPPTQPAPVLPPHQFRIFSLPSYLTNPELRSLCRLFPAFIASPARGSARFPRAGAGAQQADVDLEAAQPPTAKVGHGELRVGQRRRDAGWRGTWWQRLVLWLRALFGLA